MPITRTPADDPAGILLSNISEYGWQRSPLAGLFGLGNQSDRHGTSGLTSALSTCPNSETSALALAAAPAARRTNAIVAFQEDVKA
jgi:hypothetical protein